MIHNTNLLTINSNTLFSSQNNIEENSILFNRNTQFINFLSYIINSSNNETEDEFQDVVVTVDDNDIDKLKIIEVENDLNINCTICLFDIKKNDKIIELNCSHKYHSDCILKYIQEYNYKCPICLEEDKYIFIYIDNFRLVNVDI